MLDPTCSGRSTSSTVRKATSRLIVSARLGRRVSYQGKSFNYFPNAETEKRLAQVQFQPAKLTPLGVSLSEPNHSSTLS